MLMSVICYCRFELSYAGTLNVAQIIIFCVSVKATKIYNEVCSFSELMYIAKVSYVYKEHCSFFLWNFIIVKCQ